MPIFGKPKYSEVKVKKVQIPDGRWMRCVNCNELIDAKIFQQEFKVCPRCKYHYKMTAQERIDSMIDEGTFIEWDPDLLPADPLNFVDTKSYTQRQKEAEKKSGQKEAIITGRGEIEKFPTGFGAMDFNYIGGSMGSVVGEKITRLIERSIEQKLPVVLVSASGGARMMESAYSLMQMAKTSGALARLDQQKLPFISILTNPTTGGVSASFASLGDIVIAEPDALIGFAGPRVIQQTIRQELPEGFQRSEFNLSHGMIDMIVSRKELKSKVAYFINFLCEGDQVEH